MIKRFIFRDDDIAANTSLEYFQPVHELLVSRRKTHTIAVICNGFETNTPVVDYIKNNNYWCIQMHGWVHERYGLFTDKQIADDIDLCIKKIEDLFGVTPTKWYLPWNGWTPELGVGHELDQMKRIKEIASFHGIDADIDCDHMGHFSKCLEEGEKPKTKTIYFHSWSKDDVANLPHLIDLTEDYCNKYVRDTK